MPRIGLTAETWLPGSHGSFPPGAEIEVGDTLAATLVEMGHTRLDAPDDAPQATHGPQDHAPEPAAVDHQPEADHAPEQRAE